MCGIAGLFSNKSVQSTVIENMTNSMPHRGPDAAGFYTSEDGTVGLGHRRLSIIDLSSAANQPMFSHCKKYVMVFNGEIFNYQEIAKELAIHFQTHSDSEVILEAFIRWGPSFVTKLNGMFSLAIYAIEKKELYLFRDRLGVKPLYYSTQEKQLVFGSELKSVLPGVLSKPVINSKAVYYFLHLGYIPEPISIYQNILKFPAGSYGIYDGSSLQIHSYWKSEDKVEATAALDFESAKKQLKELIISSVQYRMIADVPFGTFLSGGIDSSMVTAAAQSISSKPIKTFSIGIKDSKFNEAEFAKKISTHLKTEHYEYSVTEQDALALVEQMINAYDEPFADSSSIPTMLVSKMARQEVTMTLSGDGGDELFQGYGMYNWAMRLNNPLLQTNRHWIALLMKQLPARYQRAADVIKYPSRDTLPAHLFSQEQYLFSANELQHLLIETPKESDLLQHYFTTKRALNPAEEQALFDIHYYLKDDLLTKVDRASMQFSLETRTPFLDYRLVEFALNLPYEFKVQKGISKYILKEVLYDFIPTSYFDRPKWGFSIPMDKWLKTDLRPMVDKYLSEELVTKAGLVQWDKVKSLKTAYFTSKPYLYNRVWALVVLHKWYYTFIA